MKNKKKKVLLAGLLLVASVTFTSYSHSKEKEFQNLVLENIEALAAGEGGMNACIGSGSLDCPLTHDKVEYVIEDYSLESFN